MADPRVPFLSFVGGGLAGAAVVLAIVWNTGSADPAPGPAAPPAPSPVSPAAATAVDLEPVLRRLDDVAGRLERLEGRLDGLANAPARTPAAGPAAAPATVDVDSLIAAMTTVEQRKLEALSDQELLDSARRLAKDNQPGAAQQRFESVLQRPLTAEQRGEVQTELAMLLRNRSDDASRAEAARLLQAVVDEHGLASRVGGQAAFQLVWTHGKHDPARGLAQADAIAGTHGVSPELRRNARWAAAILAQGLGDRIRARADYEALLRELDGQPGQEKLVTDIRRRLAEL